MNKLVFRENDFKDLREGLFKAAPSEAAAVLLAGYLQEGDNTKLLVRQTFFPDHSSLDRQSPVSVDIKPEFLAPLIKRAREEDLSLVFVHTHPFSQEPKFSMVDDEGESILFPSVLSRAPDRPHAWLVLGSSGFQGRIRFPDSTVCEIDEIVACGHHFKIQSNSMQAEVDFEVVDRTVRAIGAEGQRLLQQLHVGIVGLGGMGSLVAEQLAHLRVGQLTLLDHDSLEATNLNRVVGSSPTDVGKAKVEVAQQLISRISPSTSVHAYQGSGLYASWGRKLLNCDLIICCTDSHGSRAVLNQLAYQYYIPVLDLGVRIDADNNQLRTFGGRVQMLSPGLPCLACQNFLDAQEVRLDFMTEDERRKDPYVIGARIPQPAVISLNGTIASLGITMLISFVTGLPVQARQQIYQGERGTVRAVSSNQFPNCIVCSLDGALGRGDSFSMPWRPDGHSRP